MSGGWKYAAASVIGTSHQKSSNPICQDSHSCEFDADTRRMVCVVSDGAGSASHSERGSRLACELVVEKVSTASDDIVYTSEFALKTLGEIKDALGKQAANDESQLRDYACTLLVAILGQTQASFWQIGDGAICFRFAQEEHYSFAFWPQKGEYANVTEFVTDSHAETELQFDTVDNCPADVAVFSDGLERLALDFTTGEAHSKFFAGFFPYLYGKAPGRLVNIDKELEKFLGSERVNNRTDDDKTIVLATTEGS